MKTAATLGGRLAATVFLLAGSVLMALTLRSVGWAELLAAVRAVGVPGTALFLCVYPLACAWDVAGWRMLFPPSASPRVSLGPLYGIRLAGEALNSVTPFADVGGEPLKAELCAEKFGILRREALSSVLAGRAVLLYSEVIFWLIGLALAWPRLPRSGSWQAAMWVTLLAGIGLCVGVYALQRGGIRAAVESVSAWLRLRLPDRVREGLREVDRYVSEMYTARIGAFGASMALHLAGWIAGAGEIYVLFRLCGIEAGLTEALILEALLHLTKTASFFVPGNLGAQEAGLALGAAWLGIPPAFGVAASLLKRFRQIIWGLAGIAVLGWYRRGRPGRPQGTRKDYKESDRDESPATAAVVKN
ncbi:MAG: hypothetical protein MOGMAGMI_01652 [Candidatus Omnitrophica bacterium]|nr:hypothetical protein [Candidatus Omnitrophota bacterium]